MFTPVGAARRRAADVLHLASRRRALDARRGRCRGARASRPPAHRLCRSRRPRRRAIRTTARASQADIVVGADGIHSTVRGTAVRAGEAALHRLRRLSRPGADRAARASRPAARSRSSGSGRAHMSCITRCTAGKLVNFVCLVDREAWTKESWTEPGDLADALRAFCRLAPAGARHHRCGGRDLRLGPVRPRAACRAGRSIA